MTTAEYEQELENLTRDVLFHTTRFNELLNAVRDIEQARTCQVIWERLQGLIRSYDYKDPEDWHAGLAEQAPDPETYIESLYDAEDQDEAETGGVVLDDDPSEARNMAFEYEQPAKPVPAPGDDSPEPPENREALTDPEPDL